MTRRRILVVLGLLLMQALAARTSAQNRFEVQVFPDENAGRGETAIELHNVVMPSGTRVGDQMPDPSRHVHLSMEVTHGWTDAFETGLFLETAPLADDEHAAFAGWHVRAKLRFGQWRHIPFHVSLSVEYALFKQPGDHQFRQALAITPIFERHNRAFDLSVNPGLEVVVRGPDAGSSPVFEPSAKAAAKAPRSFWLGLEYYAETGSIKHFEPLSQQHHLLFSAIDLRTSSRWDLNVGVGRGLNGGSEHWVVKSILGMRLRR